MKKTSTSLKHYCIPFFNQTNKTIDTSSTYVHLQTVQTIIILIFYSLAVGLEVSSLALDGLVPLGLHLGEQPLGQWVVGLALLLQSIDLLLVFHICHAFLKLVPRSQLLELVRASFIMIFIIFILGWAVLAYREGILALGVRVVGLL